MKRYQYPQRGLTLFEVSVAISVAIMLLMAFTSFHLKIVERSLIEQTAYRAKLVYEATLNYRANKGEWPEDTAALMDEGYIPELAAETSWGQDISVSGTTGARSLNMKFDVPSEPIGHSIAARLPTAQSLTTAGVTEVTEFIAIPGQEFSLASLQDLAGERPWTGSHDAGNNDLTGVNTLTARFIATNEEVIEGDSCSAETDATEEEKKNKPGKGARAMAEVTDGVFAPVFCDGTTWVREDQYAFSDCKVCITCVTHVDDFAMPETCGNLSEWTGMDHLGCHNFVTDKLAIKFVCD